MTQEQRANPNHPHHRNPNLSDVTLVFNKRINRCGFAYYVCKSCDFWVPVNATRKLVHHVRRFHVTSIKGQPRDLEAFAYNVSLTTLRFPQFQDTNYGDYEISNLFENASDYLETTGFIKLPFVQLFNSYTDINYFLCPFCDQLELEEGEVRKHVFKHLHLTFG